MRHTILSVLLLLAGASVHAEDGPPARLRVSVERGALTYELINDSPYRVVGFQVDTAFTSGGYQNLACGVVAKVKSEADMVVKGACRLPVDSETGQAISQKSRLTRVEFANGMSWKATN